MKKLLILSVLFLASCGDGEAEATNAVPENFVPESEYIVVKQFVRVDNRFANLEMKGYTPVQISAGNHNTVFILWKKD